MEFLKVVSKIFSGDGAHTQCYSLYTRLWTDLPHVGTFSTTDLTSSRSGQITGSARFPLIVKTTIKEIAELDRRAPE